MVGLTRYVDITDKRYKIIRASLCTTPQRVPGFALSKSPSSNPIDPPLREGRLDFLKSPAQGPTPPGQPPKAVVPRGPEMRETLHRNKLGRIHH